MTERWPDPPPLFELAGLAAEDRDEERPPEPPAAAPPEAVASPAPAAEASPGLRLDRIAVFDLETTGVDVHSDRIVTAYVGLLDSEGAIVHAEGWLADPGVEIPAGATAVHGVTTQRARAEGRPAGEVVTEIVEALRTILAGGIPVVAYNAPYDLSLLHAEALRHGIAPLENPRPIIDPLVIDKALDRFRKGKRTLDIVAAHYGVALDDAHEASADAIAAGRIALALATARADDLPSTLDALHEQQVVWAREQAESLTEYFVRIGKLGPSESLDGTWPAR